MLTAAVRSLLGLILLASFGFEAAAGDVGFEERVRAQRAIEQVYWSHRSWPEGNPGPKPALAEVLPDPAIEARVRDYLQKSAALEALWGRPISTMELQAELDRMVMRTRAPEVLRELFDALGNDAFLIAETLARPNLADRLIRERYATDDRFHGKTRRTAEAAVAACRTAACMKAMGGTYRERTWRRAGQTGPAELGALDARQWKARVDRLAHEPGLVETPEAFSVSAPIAQSTDEIEVATVVWTKRPFDAWWQETRGSVPAGAGVDRGPFRLLSPELTACTNDTWAPTSLGPTERNWSSAVWTGAEMIVWGGLDAAPLNSGGRYVPATDTWVATSQGAGVPIARGAHAAVWTGTAMIVWGGVIDQNLTPTASGGRYNPATDSWTATSEGANVPFARAIPTAVWTGTVMIIWGGGAGDPTNDGGRYNPATNTWAATSGLNVPAPRNYHSAVWTGSRMIVWGGRDASHDLLRTGGRYDPIADSWAPTSTGAGNPSARAFHRAVWTGTEMIVWGGEDEDDQILNTGGRYNPGTDTWAPTPTGANLPTPRSSHSAVWTGREMIVWGGFGDTALDSGGRYDPINERWSPTSSGTNLPEPRGIHVAVWTGSEMVVWGGSGDGLLATGARYCACPSFYRDVDGDGYGNPALSTTDCTGATPAGHVIVGTDCNDGDPTIHPGVSDASCNGVDEDCSGVDDDGYVTQPSSCGTVDCPASGTLSCINGSVVDSCVSPLPAAVGTVSLAKSAGTALLSWAPGDGTGWNVYAGTLTRPWVYNETCLVTWTDEPSASDVRIPAPGQGYYYLVSAVDVCGESASGQATGGPHAPPNPCAIACRSNAACDDGNACTDDVCDHAVGCSNLNNTASCSDGSVCTTSDTCAAGTCVPGAPVSCDDGNPCTTDTCDAVLGCQHDTNTLPCDDGNSCTSGDVCASGTCAGTAAAATSHLVISQVQVEGDGALPAEDEFVEIYNPTSLPISLAGKSLQWKTNAGGAVYSKHDFAAGSVVPPYGWFLLARPGYNGPVAADELNPDFPLANVVGNLFLVNDTVLLSGACPVLTTILDKVAYGTGACPEGGVAASQPPPNDSIVRKPGGVCGNGTDTDHNGADFMVQSPATPRNVTTSPGGICSTLDCDDGNPCTIDSCSPSQGCVHTTPPPASHLVISQVQVEGDGVSAAGDEFVEIYNPTSAPISLAGKSLQWKTNAGGAVYSKHDFGSGTVPAHGWFLLAGTGYNGSVAANQVNSAFALANVVGNLFLVNDTVLLSGACPVLTTVLDKVSYGTGFCPEGGVAAPQPAPNDSILRRPGGTCGNGTDTDNNAADFVTRTPALPRNASSPPQP